MPREHLAPLVQHRRHGRADRDPGRSPWIRRPSSPRSSTAHSSAVRCSSVETRQSASRPHRPGAARARCGLLPMSAASRVISRRRSMPRSKTLTEWVSAPTEMKSTPVSATSRARSMVSPPEASSVARPALIAHRLGHRRGRHVVEQDLGAAGVEQLAQLVEVGHLDLDPQIGVRRPHGLVGRHHAAGRDHVVVLDHRPVDEAEPVVDPAAAARRRTSAARAGRQRLAGVEHPGAGALECGDPRRGRGRDAGEVAGEVERGPLGGEQAADRPGNRASRRRRRRPRCRRRSARHVDPVAPPPITSRKTSSATPRPATTPASRASKSAIPRASAAMVATLVTSSVGQVLGQRGGDQVVRRPRVEAGLGELVAAAAPGARRTASVRASFGHPGVGRSVSEAGAGLNVTVVTPSVIATSKWPAQCSSSRSGKSSRQCEPRVSSRSAAASASAALMVSRFVVSQECLVDLLGRVAGRACRAARWPRRARRRCAARRPATSSSPGGRGAPTRDQAGRPRVGGRLGPRPQLVRAAPRRSAARTPGPRAASWTRAGWRRARRSRRPRRWRRGRARRCGPHRSVRTPPDA